MTDGIVSSSSDKIKPFNTLKNVSHCTIIEESFFELGAALLQRKEYINDSKINWFATSELEQSIDAYLDLIDLSGGLGFDIAQNVLSFSEDDDFLGVIYSLANGKNSSTMEYDFLIDRILTLDDIEQSNLYADAFKHGATSEFLKKLLTLIKSDSALVKLTGLELFGYCGGVDPQKIWPLFHDKDESVKTAAMVAVMRLGFKKAVPAMEQAVLENKEMFYEHRLFPLLMLGSKKALEFSRRACQSANYIKPQYPIYLALGGNEEDIAHILKVLEFEGMNSAVLEALGIFGSLKGVNTLMKFLSSENDEDKLAAAKSLNQISGAQLYETITVIEKDEPDIDPEDITGIPAGSGEEKQLGDERTIEIKQDCTDKERWVQWWQENKSRFDTSIRYRHGEPYSFLLCLREIAHHETKHDDRQRAYNELVMRSGHYIPFEPDWFVDKQIEALKKWRTWWNENKTQLTNQWMFDGH